MKSLFQLVLSVFLLVFALIEPLSTLYESHTTHEERQATVTNIESSQSKNRRGRVFTHRQLYYTYTVGTTTYTGTDHTYEPDASVRPGDPVRVLTSRADPAESRIAETDIRHVLVRLALLAASAWFFFSWYRGRRT
jgi:hypothetical protein